MFYVNFSFKNIFQTNCILQWTNENGEKDNEMLEEV